MEMVVCRASSHQPPSKLNSRSTSRSDLLLSPARSCRATSHAHICSFGTDPRLSAVGLIVTRITPARSLQGHGASWKPCPIITCQSKRSYRFLRKKLAYETQPHVSQFRPESLQQMVLVIFKCVVPCDTLAFSDACAGTSPVLCVPSPLSRTESVFRSTLSLIL